ncbi:MAG: DUF2244 domain-containing protein [Rubrivivax sp.]|nr:DUF2244 domain-containing protein [Rubrivivax sp.]
MSATYASSPWPERAPAPRSFGCRLTMPGPGPGPGGTVAAVQWLFKRNCSITPRQLAGVFASLCAVSSVIGAFFYWHGAPYVAAFAGIELLAVGAALLIYARHAGDCETLTLMGRLLLIEQCHGSRVEHTQLSADWLTVEPAAGQGSLVELRGRGRTVQVGRHLRPEWRGLLAQELRQALRQAHVVPMEPGAAEICNDSN